MFFVFLGTLLAYLLVVVPTGRFIASKISSLYLKTTVTQQSFIEESATFSCRVNKLIAVCPLTSYAASSVDFLPRYHYFNFQLILNIS